MSYKTYSMELAGRTLSIDIGRVAKQANGAALMHYGDTTVLCTATASDKPREGIDFFPLSVEFEEKMYSVGKIPGGFNKREGKSSDAVGALTGLLAGIYYGLELKNGVKGFETMESYIDSFIQYLLYYPCRSRCTGSNANFFSNADL